MDKSFRKPLRWFVFWRASGWFYVGLIVFLSLSSSVVSPPEFFQADKLKHFFAYFLMMLWFAQLYVSKAHKWWVVAFVMLGVLLEVLQGQTAYRTFDYGDMIANALGILTAWRLSMGAWGMFIYKLEHNWFAGK